jgi:hypothetical protein
MTATILVSALALWILSIAAPAEPIRIGSESQLFIDDHLIERMDGLTRTLHQPVDVATNPVIEPEQPWEHRRIPYGSVIYSAPEKKFRCWYLGMNIYDSRPGFRGYRKEHHIPIHEAASICYAESDDGIHWRKPVLGLHEFRGSKKNNIVLPCPGTHFDSTSVIHTPHNPEHPWKLISFIGLWPYQKELIEKRWGDTKFGITRHGHYAWSSRDGIRWSPMNDGKPVLRAHDRSMFWWDSRQKLYVAAAKSNHQGKRAQRYAWSRDAINWTITKDFIHLADERDHPGDQAEAAYGFNYANQYLGFSELRRERQGEATKINWELLSSRDGRHWERPLRQPFFPDAAPDTWRYQVLKIFANPPIERDGHLLIYYSGKTGLVPVETGYEAFQALCVATLRKDGFVSLDAGPKPGELLTKPFVSPGNRLHLNLELSAGGSAAVEVQDQTGIPFPGYSLKDCNLIRTGRIGVPVKWTPGARLALPANQPIRLRIKIRKGSLYSFILTDEAGPR